MFSQYGPLCTEVYELTKPVGTEINGDITYYYSRLKETSGKVLEAGVGTGRLLIPLLEKGLEVEGVDQSESMLATCQKNLVIHQQRTNLYHEDVVMMTLPVTYEAIIMPTSSFSLVGTGEVALKVLTNFYAHLNKGGRLIMDLDLPFYPEVGEAATSTYEISESVGITLESKIIGIDWLTQQIISYLTYQKWDQGQLVGTELQRLSLKWYGLEELKLLLESVGFQEVVISADYEYGQAPQNSNQTITFECSK